MLRRLLYRLAGRAAPGPWGLANVAKRAGAIQQLFLRIRARKAGIPFTQATESAPPSPPRAALSNVTLPRAIPPRPQASGEQHAGANEAPLRPHRPIPWRQIALTSVALSVILALLLTLYASQARQPRLTLPAVLRNESSLPTTE